MKEHPILFNGDMVRALLSGAKTQTRRVLKPQPQGTGPGGCPLPIIAAYRIGDGWDFQSADGATQAVVCCPYGVPGDVLWVRERHRITYYSGKQTAGVEYADHRKEWKTKPPDVGYRLYKWRPSIHMPRWASRITLENGPRIEVVKAPARTADDYNEMWAKKIPKWYGQLILPDDEIWHWDWDFTIRTKP